MYVNNVQCIVLGKLDTHLQKNKTEPLSQSNTKIKSKWIKYLKCKT